VTGALGDKGERVAAAYLEGKGYRILHRNYRFGRGEIDLIARKGGTIVFVEVKTRSSDSHGEPEEAVTPAKVRQIRKVASAYLAQRRIGECDCRFDVIAVLPREGGLTVRHTEDIFS
jgi:putative endonuclease